MLSFARAAALYRVALELGPPDDRDPAQISERLGTVLVAAGRGKEAADAFLDAAGGRSGVARMELQRRAGEQQLRAGYLARGRETLREVMSELGLRLPSSRLEAIGGLLYWRLRLRWRGLDMSR